MDNHFVPNLTFGPQMVERAAGGLADPARRAPDDHGRRPLGTRLRRAGRVLGDLPRRGDGRSRRRSPAGCATIGARAGLALKPGTAVDAVPRAAARVRPGARHDRRARLRRPELHGRHDAEARAPCARRSTAAGSTSGCRSTAASPLDTIGMRRRGGRRHLRRRLQRLRRATDPAMRRSRRLRAAAASAASRTRTRLIDLTHE